MEVPGQLIALRVSAWGNGFCQTQELDPTWTAASAAGLINMTPIAIPRMGAKIGFRLMDEVSSLELGAIGARKLS
jgi:hypothetical protein